VWIISMFTDEAHGVYRQIITAQRQSIFDRRIDLKAVFLCETAAQVIGWKLRRVHRDELSTGRREYAIRGIACEQPTKNDGRMRYKATLLNIHRNDGCHFFLFGWLRLQTKAG